MNSTILFTAILLAAPALKEPPKQDIKLAGEWIVETQVSSGRPLKSNLVRRYVFTAEGKWVMTTVKGKNPPNPIRPFEIDVAKKPATIDMRLSTAPNATVYWGIVKMDGDTLTICYSREADGRPTKFESPEGSSLILLVLKRAPKE